MDQSSCKSDFVNVNGIRLHYLDWGGDGPALVFIPGWGCNAYIFGRFAPRFTDHFHVLGFTRRGHGDSDYPETGYDADTLTEDLRQFMDALGIDRVILIGHSLAYIELSRFATLYPQRVQKLVFLDAIYERHSEEFKAVKAKNPLPGMTPPWPTENLASVEACAATVNQLYPSLAVIWGELMEANMRHSIKQMPDGGWVDKETEGISRAIGETVNTYAAPYTDIQAPLLSIHAIQNPKNFISYDYMSDEQRAQVVDFFENVRIPYDRQWIEQFQRAMPRARVVVLPNGHHYCFIQQEEQVFDEMRAFLLDS